MFQAACSDVSSYLFFTHFWDTRWICELCRWCTLGYKLCLIVYFVVRMSTICITAFFLKKNNKKQQYLFWKQPHVYAVSALRLGKKKKKKKAPLIIHRLVCRFFYSPLQGHVNFVILRTEQRPAWTRSTAPRLLSNIWSGVWSMLSIYTAALIIQYFLPLKCDQSAPTWCQERPAHVHQGHESSSSTPTFPLFSALFFLLFFQPRNTERRVW